MTIKEEVIQQVMKWLVDAVGSEERVEVVAPDKWSNELHQLRLKHSCDSPEEHETDISQVCKVYFFSGVRENMSYYICHCDVASSSSFWGVLQNQSIINLLRHATIVKFTIDTKCECLHITLKMLIVTEKE